MKRLDLGILGVALASLLIGCGSGTDTVAEVITPEPAPIEVTVVVDTPEPVVTVVVIENNETNEEIPEDFVPIEFEGLRVAYNVEDVNCSGGEASLIMTFKADEEVDLFSFILEHTIGSDLVDFSTPNVGSNSGIVKLTDTLYIPANDGDTVLRHGLVIKYYGEEIQVLSSHYFDQPACIDTNK